jgi:protein TonB
MKRFAQRASAVVLSLLVNLFFVVLLTKVNAFVDDEKPDSPSKTKTITIYDPIPEKRPKPTRSTRSISRAPRPRQSTVPNLPSPVSMPRLMLSDSHNADFTGSFSAQLEALSTDFVFKEEAVDTPPKVISRVMPKYPRSAERRRLEGYVVFRIKLTNAGLIEKIWIEASKPEGIFEVEAEKAIQQYRFSPAKFKGKPVPVICRQKIVFQLGG